jgi:hypothetical protein
MNNIKTFFERKFHTFLEQKYSFLKNENVTLHRGGRGGVYAPVSPKHGGGEAQNRPKQCLVLFEWPL